MASIRGIKDPRIPPVTHKWLKRRYRINQPKAAASFVELPPKELISRKTTRPVTRGVTIFDKNYKIEEIVYCLENPNVLPEEMPKEVLLTYPDIYENYFLEDGILKDRITRLEVTQAYLTPIKGKESITRNEVIRVLEQEGMAGERMNYIEKLHKKVETLEGKITRIALKLQELGIEI